MSWDIVALSDRPELAPIIAPWHVDAFFDRPAGDAVEQVTRRLLAPPQGPEETFVLLDGGEPVGTASLTYADLAARPDLTPWLASVFVTPAFRGRGIAAALVRRVELFAAQAGVPLLWLYTTTAEPLYARLGWRRLRLEPDGGRQVVLMQKRLLPAPDSRGPAT